MVLLLPQYYHRILFIIRVYLAQDQEFYPQGGGVTLRLDVDAFTIFLLMVLAIFFIFFQHKSNFNQMNGSGIIMPQIKKWWLQSTNEGVLNNHVD